MRKLFWMTALVAIAAAFCTDTSRASNIQTNWVERWITNTVEVQMQANRFVTEFHTNWVERVKTNVLDVYATNHLTKTLTNVLDVYATNYVTKTLTNNVTIDLVQTNLVRSYRTNLHTLQLTNWMSVMQFKTNWVNQSITNLVEIEMPVQNSAEIASPKAAGSENVSIPTVEASTESLTIQASRSSPLTANNQVEVRLTARWTNNVDTPLQVQQWRVEAEDGSFLCFGQDRDFKRRMPVGTYKIQVKIKRDSGDPLIGRGTLTITPREVLIAQKPSVKKSSI
jgi:hypothetical protein